MAPLIMISLLSLIALPTAYAYTFFYTFTSHNSEEVNECFNAAIARIQHDTCVVFHHKYPRAKNLLTFSQSSRCGWQEDNSTIHVGPDCMTANHCLEYVHHAIAGERQHPSTILRNLNLKFNCTDKCSLHCENGGSLSHESCQCDCAYGFTGKRCESLKHASRFTDSSCGFVSTHHHGTLSLSQRNSDKPAFCQWVLKTNDPWERIEVELLEMDFDYTNAPPGQNCPDQLLVSVGHSELVGPLPCGAESMGKRIRSDSNVMLVEYRGSPFSSPREHKGPVIRYSVVPPPPPAGNEIRSFKYQRAPSSAPSLGKSLWWSVVWPAAVLVASLLVCRF